MNFPWKLCGNWAQFAHSVSVNYYNGSDGVVLDPHPEKALVSPRDFEWISVIFWRVKFKFKMLGFSTFPMNPNCGASVRLKHEKCTGPGPGMGVERSSLMWKPYMNAFMFRRGTNMHLCVTFIKLHCIYFKFESCNRIVYFHANGRPYVCGRCWCCTLLPWAYRCCTRSTHSFSFRLHPRHESPPSPQHNLSSSSCNPIPKHYRVPTSFTNSRQEQKVQTGMTS